MGKKNLLILAIILLVFAVVIWQLQKSKTKQNSESTKSTSTNTEDQKLTEGEKQEINSSLQTEDQNFESRCANGDWVNVANLGGQTTTLSGKLRRVYSEDDISQELKNFQFYIENQGGETALSGTNLSSLDDFEDREVEVQAVKASNGASMEVVAIRCAGVETDKTAMDGRMKIMNWISANIGTIAPQKAPYRAWTADTAEFVDAKNVYVDYYDSILDDENADISDDPSRRVLLQISQKSDGNFDFQVLAYWEMGEDDYVLKSGTDKFEDVSDTIMYQYDPDEKSWTRI